MKRVLLVFPVLLCGQAFAQNNAPTLSPTSLSFTYQVGAATFPKAQTVKATLPSSVPSSTQMAVAFDSMPAGWLTVTPSGATAGTSPLTLSVTVNPTSLSPGQYTGHITVTNPIAPAPSNTITVTLAITSPPSSLSVTCPIPGFDAAASGVTTPSLTFNYTSGGAVDVYELDVSTTGDIIPFTVTTGVSKGSGGTTANWLRVNNATSGTGLYSTSTSGVAGPGSNVKINLTLDQATLNSMDSLPYAGTVTIAAVNAANGTYPVNVTLNVFAGTPVLNSIFPLSMPALPAMSAVTPINPVLTIYGDNFFASGSKVFLQPPNGTNLGLKTTWVSRKVLTAEIPYTYLTPTQSVPPYPVAWQVTVINGAAGSSPSNSGSTSAPQTFNVTDPSLPYVQSVVNAGSYWPTATQLGPNPNPVVPPNTAISPREIISIFGQNLGPSTLVSAVPNGSPLQYPTTLAGITVSIQVNGTPFSAPVIMACSNQINAIVPVGVSAYIGSSATITVTNGAAPPYDYTNAIVVGEDPALFTFGGNGQGQAAVLNFDSSTGAVTVNGKSASAARGSTIEIFATGLGDVVVPASGVALLDGEVASGAVKLLDDTYRVLIDGQSAVVSYGGTAGNSVAGLVQLNATIPPNARTGAAIPITVEIGAPAPGPPLVIQARRSQTGATIAIK